MRKAVALLIAAALIAATPACMTRRRAERRIERLVARYPELLQLQTVGIDTTIVIPARRDSTVFTLDGAPHRTPVAKDTRQGTFTLSVDTASRTAKVTYTSIADTIYVEKTVEVPKIVVESADRRKVQRWSWVACLFAALFATATAVIVVQNRGKK